MINWQDKLHHHDKTGCMTSPLIWFSTGRRPNRGEAGGFYSFSLAPCFKILRNRIEYNHELTLKNLNRPEKVMTEFELP